MPQRRVHLRIRGLVQGVSYRASAKDAADRFGLTGWVRNLPDGDVESVAEGEAEAIEAYVRWCQSGPEEARVEKVDTNEQTPTREFDGFRVTR